MTAALERIIPGLADFPVTPCTAHFYQKPDGWWWYCITCHTSTQVRKHGRGHRTAAEEGMTEHVRQIVLRRQRALWQEWWNGEVDAADDPEWFRELWEARFPDWNWNPGIDIRAAMYRVQQGRRDRAGAYPG